ncbi:hypothetical protein Tsubulata_017786 [Turnera subulata]|uniref:Kinesin motor domain-containing protein n=1 Tax=Turnera subulata TaxID=218843 RepID=A0A9Q0J754_9ROSI|nr:hypothetical protein Tsubulata_017786 [Turnera subulata]
MLRDFKFMRRNPAEKNAVEETENVPVNPRDSTASQASADSSSVSSSFSLSRPPLSAIQDPTSKPEPEHVPRVARPDRTPTKPKSSSGFPLRTPEKHGGGVGSLKSRYGWGQRGEEARGDDASRVGWSNLTPRAGRAGGGRAGSGFSESSSTQSTPSKSVSKPPSVGLRGKGEWSYGGGRVGNFAALYRGIPVSGGGSAVVNTVDVPHFELKEDPSFWMEHNVQVLIRIRPLNSMERSMHGYNRCLRQESCQSITWIGQPDTRFTFDHVACETVDQEMLFRGACLPMVENCLSGYNSCIFAYGQTGSGKTYTMLGEIDDLEMKPSPHRGMTPRIFEFLFARIQAEEESRRDEKLKYNCKCSFLEIYNEQIIDLLDPSSTNLLLREDVKQGVYVENLSEFEVQTVSDIIRLLTQGSLNRKVAATNMNRESSRSHSVFTCVIESRWENDSTTNLRFARLNLVDLAGSERQKSSGAEGERLKEAANINKSLSTLGHVIMILVDVANGKPRHVPYRDSRLTFLLQDSLGGNSKTMIIANVSPSICCAAETLNTLKFAQRAKLIQNNAVVNEDSTGDVIALQNQIRLLKEELSLLKRQTVFRSLSFGSTVQDARHNQNNTSTEKIYETDQEKANFFEIERQKADGFQGFEPKGVVRMSTKQLRSLESTLAGALRREQMAETSIKKLEAEIEQLNRLVRQREEDTRSTKMMLRFREDKIQRLESCLGGSLPPDNYLQEENRALTEEIKLLQAKVDKNPEVTRFALENIRLLDQLRRFQEFYEEGEREILLDEVSKLREQMLQFFNAKPQHTHPNTNTHPKADMQISKDNNALPSESNNTLNELEECRRTLNSCLEENRELRRELNELHFMLDSRKSSSNAHDCTISPLKDTVEAHTSESCMKNGVLSEKDNIHATSVMKHTEELLDLQLELDIFKVIFKEERSSRAEAEEKMIHLSIDLELANEKLIFVNKQFEESTHELKEAKSVIEALESQQILMIDEMEELKKSNSNYMMLLSAKELEIMGLKEELSQMELRCVPANHSGDEGSTLQRKLKRMQDSLEKAKRLNTWYHNDRVCQASNEEEMDEVREQAEAETAEVIVCLQEELSVLQLQVQDCNSKELEYKNAVMLLENEVKLLQEKLHLLTDDNVRLNEILDEKDGELRKLSEECELLACEMEVVLADGQEALAEASDQVELITNSFPQKRIWISEQVGRLIRVIAEKELLIEDLSNCLEDANNKRSEVECMLKSLRGAALVMNEAHQQECNEREKEILFLKTQLSSKVSTISELQEKVKQEAHHASKASLCATVAFVIVNRMSEVNLMNLNELKSKDIQLRESAEFNMREKVLLNDYAASIKETNEENHSLRMELGDLKETCAELQQRLSEEGKRAFDLEAKLERVEENDILNTKEEVATLKTGISALRACLSIDANNDKKSENSETQGTCLSVDRNDRWTDPVADKTVDAPICFHQPKELRRTSTDVHDRGVTVILKKEIESALQSLQEVQEEMSKLRNENEEIRMSEKQSRESLKCFTAHIISLQEALSNFEKQFELQIEVVNGKLISFEQIVRETETCWRQTEEFLETEIGDAKITAAQKAAEASCIYAKFEEAQDTMKEADIMVNELLIANEKLKLDIEKLKEIEISSTNERDRLVNEVLALQSTNRLKDQQVEDLEKQFGFNLREIQDLVIELEGMFELFQATSKENFALMACDFTSLKCLLLESRKLVRSWLEDVWSEIIVKDSAVSVLHLCHMGILLETLTGLNAENGLLQHGLSESNSVIADLREHNLKASRELEICRALKGKLLADIRRSFDRISRKEDEAGNLGLKLTNFENKILDLQLQEESMLQRSNYMGSQLAMLMKELDLSNTTVIESLLNQEKQLKDKEERLDFQTESLKLDYWSKELESFILTSQLEEMACQRVVAEREHANCGFIIEDLKKHIILSKVETELKEQVLASQEVEVSLLQKEVQEAKWERDELLAVVNQCNLRIARMDEENRTLEEDAKLLKDVAHSNDTLRGELTDVMETNVKLTRQIQSLDTECGELLHDLQQNKAALEAMSCQQAVLEKEGNNRAALLEFSKKEIILSIVDGELQKHILMTREAEVEILQAEVQDAQREMQCLLLRLQQSNSRITEMDEGKRALEGEIQLLKDVACCNNMLKNELSEVMETKVRLLSKVQALENECARLQEFLKTTETSLKNSSSHISSVEQNNQRLQKDICMLESSLQKLQHELENKSVELQSMSSLQEENKLLKSEVSKSKTENNLLLQDLENHFKDLVSSNIYLQAELSRKDDILKGLLFDLSLLQEAASNTKDQKDKIEEMLASLETLEDELGVKARELDEVVAHNQMLEAQLAEKIDTISVLELKLSKENESSKKSSSENLELKAKIEKLLAAKCLLEEDMKEKEHLAESLEVELTHMENALRQMNYTIDGLESNLNEANIEKDQLQTELHTLKEKFETTQAWAEENEAIAQEAKQMAESTKIYAEEKEAEVRLLERSVEELELTVDALENKVDILKEEAERQKLQREELEAELHRVNEQMLNLKNADTDMKRHLDETEKNLGQALKRMQTLERDIVEKNAEIVQFKTHISELNLHAEAQANEYKQKFKALEAMAEQVKPECHHSISNSPSKKSEKIAAKSRGSSSPFKCIGMGLAQQIKLEKDEELTAAKMRVEELESLAANRQKEIFALNARLAAAESMTHDVIRDLLGVKLDMTSYVSLLDNQQVQNIAERAQLKALEPRVKEQEITKLKKQLQEFIEERQGWLEEIDRKQAEMVAAQITLEKLRQRDELLKTENDMLKMENVNHKKRVMELEGEVKKLSGQQNLQQRIHHHAKIKDENNMLRLQNEELGAKLRRTEINLSRVREELAHYRSSMGRSPYVNFDEEQRLMNKIKEIEDDRVQLAQRLLGLCTSILKAAGVTKPATDITPAVAEEALEQLKSRLTSLEMELQDLTLKNRINNERMRLSELMPQTSPVNARTGDNCQTPRRVQASFLSALDR